MLASIAEREQFRSIYAAKIANYSNPHKFLSQKSSNPHKFLSQKSSNPHKSYSSLNDSVILLRLILQAGIAVPSRTVHNIIM